MRGIYEPATLEKKMQTKKHPNPFGEGVGQNNGTQNISTPRTLLNLKKFSKGKIIGAVTQSNGEGTR